MTDKNTLDKIKVCLEELKTAKYGNVIDSIYNMINSLENLVKELERELEREVKNGEPERIVRKRKEEPVKRNYKKRKIIVGSQ